MKKKNIGSSFDSWLREAGIYEQVTVTDPTRCYSSACCTGRVRRWYLGKRGGSR